MRAGPTNPFIEFKKEEIEQSVPLRFEQQAAGYPDRLAVKSSTGRLTYRELNRMANRIARAVLSQRGSDQEPVALLFPQGISLIAAMLGTLKARKIYVPLDLSYPMGWLASMLEDSGVTLILTENNGLALARALARDARDVINVDEIGSSLNDDENPDLKTSPDDLSYILYTSGTTGEPKGIFLNHRIVLHKAKSYINTSRLSAEDRVSLLVSFSFAAAVQNIFGALLSGAAVLPFDLKENGLANLAKWLIEEEITIYRSVTTVFRYFVETLRGDEEFPRLRLIDLFGEPVSTSDVERYKKHFSEHSLLRNYLASTELGDVRQYFISKETPVAGNVVPVGYPVEDKEVLLLDEAGRNVGFEQVGEIVVKSPYLALGYWGKPEMTRATFLPDPQGGDARIYRTGDLGYMLSDGCLVHLGRKDFQVKVRGHRIEPAEIEMALLGQSGIRQAVVIAREIGRRRKGLVAYLVSKQRPTPSIGELRGFLNQRLPDYKVPSAFVFLNEFPLTPSGKVDLQALPEPALHRSDLATDFVAPRNPVEETLAGIWSEVLGVKPIGIHDNFLELGGDSLMAAQLLARLRSIYAVGVPMRTFLQAPTIADLADVMTREQGRQETAASDLPLKRRSRAVKLPLSFAQESLWFIDRLDPGTPLYNIHAAVRLSGTLNVSALEESFKEIIRRHEVLRTTFVTLDGRPVQIVSPATPFTLPVMDLQKIMAGEREVEAQRLAAAETRRRFDLERGPLFRAALLRLGEIEHVLLLTMHHIVADGWSVGVLFQEISVLYNSFSCGTASPLPELPVQYADFALWQRQWLQGDALEKQLSYWKKQLGENPPVLELSTDRVRPAAQTYRGARWSATLSEGLSASLKALCRQERATLFMVLLAAFKLLLHRHTRQEDVILGATVAGRNRPELEGLIGFFVNALVLRTDLSGNPTFLEFLRRVRENCLEGYAHQDLPFEKLVQELRPDRSPNRTPLFRVLFNMHNLPEASLRLRGLAVENLVPAEVMSKFDLTLYAREQEQQVHIELVYSADFFEGARMAVLADQFQHLLEQIGQNPEDSIDRFSLVTPQTESVLPNPTLKLDATWHGAAHALFSEQARRVPEKTAVADRQGVWSYKMLGCVSNQLAHWLRGNGIQREDIVAVYCHRSPSLAWALLGVLKAGAAFLILDPAYPPLRLIDCLRGARPRGWLQLEAAGSLPEALEDFVATLPLRCRLSLPARVDKTSDGPWGRCPADDPKVEVGPDDLAYVAFTSGSTGEPKGVLCRQGPVSHFLPWLKQTFSLSDADRFSSLTGLSFNPLHREIFTPLALGATLCIPDPENIAPGRLAEWMEREAITVTHLTPAMIRVLCEVAPGTRLETLRYAFIAGDVLKRPEARMLQQVAPNATVVNFYGATETQRAVGYYVVPRGEAAEAEALGKEELLKDTIPLGRGIEDVQLLVLNSCSRLAGVGEIGEIYFRSPHLARGYIEDETLTRERFIVNPFTADPCDRLYRTRELGCYRPDGNVEFVGRVDHQVKIRGFRIQPAEIEMALGRHPGVRQAVVSTRDDVLGDKRLVAYVVANLASPPTFRDLRGFLKERLPEYMVPSAFVYLENLPLTPNGKVDRQRLPAPDHDRGAGEGALLAPRTPMEFLIAEIWKDLLGVDRIGVDDNFFDLGGHSLLAMQVVSRLEKKAGSRVEPKELLVRTLAQLAAICEERQSSQRPVQPRSVAKRVLHTLAHVFSNKDENRTG